ncbi:MAG: radical SAM protein [Oscillospiraceae bacterium]|jgi:MoaA/NifB/PqqE/SkfB family radical SAM enzyme|nr:radical SAM protein [Oscillospiraceae bacterium]
MNITACLDMAGCPNRCRHCWLGATPNGSLTPDDLQFVAAEFRPFAENLEIFSWYREPDYRDDYKALWELERQLSDVKTPHFENVSIWRTVRDADYAPWLRDLGVKYAQLTVFGGETTTDWYFGRRGAFAELNRTVDILLEHGIAPRIQTFVSKRNIGELPIIERWIDDAALEQRCADIGREFQYFLHQGSCDGENAQFYGDWVTPAELEKIPPKLAAFALKHWRADSLADIFGRTETELYRELADDESTASFVSNDVTFYIDKDFNVYPNIETPSPAWYLGNLKTDGAESVINAYNHSVSIAQNARLTVPLGDMIRLCGDRTSQRLFLKSDYIMYILNKYCEVRFAGSI